MPFTAVLHPFTHRKALNQDDLKTANCILPVQSGDGSSQSREEFSISPSFDHTPRKERPRFSILSHIDHANEANQHKTPRPIQRASTNTTRQTLSRALKPPRRVHKSKEDPQRYPVVSDEHDVEAAERERLNRGLFGASRPAKTFSEQNRHNGNCNRIEIAEEGEGQVFYASHAENRDHVD